MVCHLRFEHRGVCFTHFITKSLDHYTDQLKEQKVNKKLSNCCQLVKIATADLYFNDVVAPREGVRQKAYIHF